MKTQIYLIVTREGFDRGMKLPPKSLHPHERCIPLEIEVPDEAFDPVRLPKISMVVNPNQISKAVVVEGEEEEEGE